MPIVNNAKFHD